MSRHSIVLHSTTIGTNVAVGIGFDRPLGNIYCHVHDQDLELLYSSVADVERMHSKDVEDFVAPLEKLGVTLPETVKTNVLWDMVVRAGNLNYRYELGELKKIEGNLLTLGPMMHMAATLRCDALDLDVLVVIGYQAGAANRVFSYVGEVGEYEPTIETSRIGTSSDKGVIYSSLVDQKLMRARDVELVLQPLRKLGITVPRGMIEGLSTHMVCKGESFTAVFSATGELINSDRGLEACF